MSPLHSHIGVLGNTSNDTRSFLAHCKDPENYQLHNDNGFLLLLPHALLPKTVGVLYCIDGVVIAAQCTATVLRSIVLPEFRY